MGTESITTYVVLKLLELLLLLSPISLNLFGSFRSSVFEFLDSIYNDSIDKISDLADCIRNMKTGKGRTYIVSLFGPLLTPPFQLLRGFGFLESWLPFYGTVSL